MQLLLDCYYRKIPIYGYGLEKDNRVLLRRKKGIYRLGR